MIPRVWIINGVLAIALVICLMNIWDVWHINPEVVHGQSVAVNAKEAIQIKKIPENKVLAESDYQDVVDKNLFSPDRAPAPAEIESAEPEVKDVRISGEKVVLYGIIMLDGYKKALINNPGDSKADLKNRWVGEGEQIGNLKVQNIRQDEILLVDGSNSYRVLLYDPDKASKLSGKPAAQSKEGSQPNVITTGEKPKEAEGKTNKMTEKVTISADGKYELIDTPLGQIKRKRK